MQAAAAVGAAVVQFQVAKKGRTGLAKVEVVARDVGFEAVAQIGLGAYVAGG